MLRHMRTTIIVKDALLKAAKRRAAELDVSLSGLIEQALRAELERPPAPRRRFRLRVNETARLCEGLRWEDAAQGELASDTNGLP